MKNYVHWACTLVIGTKGRILELPNISLGKETIAWEPIITFEQNLKPSIAYFYQLTIQEDI